LPKKIEANFPKGCKDKTGKTCEQDLTFDLEVPETSPSVITIPQPSLSGQAAQMVIPPAPQATVPPPEPIKEEKKLSHDEISAMIPKGVNAMECPGNDCNHKRLKNPTQTKKYKACPGCEANTLTKDSDFCPYCSKNLDPEDLEDGIELEIEEEEE